MTDEITSIPLLVQEWQGRTDPIREFLLKDPHVIATEIRVTAKNAVILATRIQ